MGSVPALVRRKCGAASWTGRWHGLRSCQRPVQDAALGQVGRNLPAKTNFAIFFREGPAWNIVMKLSASFKYTLLRCALCGLHVVGPVCACPVLSLERAEEVGDANCATIGRLGQSWITFRMNNFWKPSWPPRGAGSPRSRTSGRFWMSENHHHVRHRMGREHVSRTCPCE